MEISAHHPETLLEAIRYFSDPDVCLDYMSKMRWPDGRVICPTCGADGVRFISTRRLWECKNKHPRRQFSIKVGTILEDSAIGLDKWLAAMWLIANAKNGISSYEIARSLGVTQKTAWFMLQRIRLAMQSNDGPLSGRVEVDETYIGGKARNMHKAKRKAKIVGRSGHTGKVAVMGLLERHGEFRYAILPNVGRPAMEKPIRAKVEGGAEVITDAFGSYKKLKDEYVHNVIDHAEKYVDGHVHTNGLENFWALLKRTITGTYVSIEPFHLFRYLDEQSFRFNNREDVDGGRFAKVSAAIADRRLTYAHLTGHLPGRVG
jgi:transposase-like protein